MRNLKICEKCKRFVYNESLEMCRCDIDSNVPGKSYISVYRKTYEFEKLKTPEECLFYTEQVLETDGRQNTGTNSVDYFKNKKNEKHGYM